MGGGDDQDYGSDFKKSNKNIRLKNSKNMPYIEKLIR